MNPDANNETPGQSFDFDAAEQQFEDVEQPDFDRDLGPAERQIARQIEAGFETLEAGLRHTLAQVEALRQIDFEEVMRDPDKAETACDFSEVVGHLHLGLAPIALATHAARAEFDDLSESA